MRNLIGLTLLLALSAASGARPLAVGFASADITPDPLKETVYLAGFGKGRRADGVHAPLKVRTVVLRDGERRVAITSVDVVGLFLPTVERIRARLPGFDYVLVCATHNHHGPDTMGLWGANAFKSGVDPAYMKRIEDAVVAAVSEAAKSTVEARAVIGKAHAPELLRDSRDPLVKHDELVALRFQGQSEPTPIGIVVQWNCHPETLDSKQTRVSPDYIESFCSSLGAKYRCPVVYLTGTVGGLMTTMRVPVKDAGGNLLPEGSIAKTERYGRLLADVSADALVKAEPVELTPFDVRTRSVLLPVANPVYRLGRQLGVLDRAMERWAGDPDAKAGRPVTTVEGAVAVRSEVSRLRLGELDIAVIPGEIYPELVLGRVQDPPEPNADYPDAAMEPAIYAQMRAKHKMIVGLGNDELGYIIPRRQWDSKPPYCYGLKSAPYGEINSLGAETAPIICQAFRKLAQ